MKFLGKVVKDEIDIKDYLEENGAIEPKQLIEDLEVYKLVSPGYSGGKIYEVWQYIAPSTKKTNIMCTTKIGYADMANTEIIVFSVEENETIEFESLIIQIQKINDDDNNI